jgi:hypothetical protein
MKKKNQVYNPFLPLYEYIPDGEPHVFGDRVYHYGSHDREGGYTFCMEDYVVYSAPVDDLTNWRYEGVTYRASQDPNYPKLRYMYAPDVVRGNDGKYYLYYCMGGDYGIGGYTGPISVAVCDSPAGRFEFLGFVQYPDGTPMMDYVCFDPAALNDDGTIRIYYGTQYDFEEREDFDSNPDLLKSEMDMFGRTEEEILGYRQRPESCPNSVGSDCIMGPVMVVLCDDMLTVKEKPHHIIPYRVKGTGFEEHPFFEGSSMRKSGDMYYFVYSSWLNHELCYATSRYPDRDFVFRGTIVSNGDIGLDGRQAKDRLNMTGTTHGSIVEIAGQWYVFYHRLTHKSDYSRQACAEKIYIDEEGYIQQVEITSCGLNAGALKGESGYAYPAVICCNLTNGHMPHGSNSVYPVSFPNVTNSGDERFIAEIGDGTLIGYKYFDFKDMTAICITVRSETDENRVVFNGPIRLDERCESGEADAAEEKNSQMYIDIKLNPEGEMVGKIILDAAAKWKEYRATVKIPDGESGLYFMYHGAECIQIKGFRFV